MKDITHYFTDLSKNLSSVSPSAKEVNEERAKNDESLTVLSQESSIKRKRNRVKMKISREFNEEAVCNVLDSSSDIIDRTPSLNLNERPLASHGNTPTRSTLKEIVTDMQSTKQIKRIASENRTCCNASGLKINNDAEMSTDQINNSRADKIDTYNENRSVARKDKHKKIKKFEKSANQQGYSKRKIAEEEDAAEVEKRLEKRMKLFIDSTKSSQLPSQEGLPEISDSIYKKRTNLLNYFSKTTPEQLEKERLMKTKVVVEAEIHKPENSLVDIGPVLDEEKKSIKRIMKINPKRLPEEFDEICLIQSETLILSPRNEKLTSPLQQNKPKWSLKIQLSNNSLSTSGSEDKDLYTPSTSSNLQNQNIKNNRNIPKVLLPKKSKRNDLNTFSPDSPREKNEEIGKNIRMNKERELKTTKIEFRHKNQNKRNFIGICNGNDLENEKHNVTSSDMNTTVDDCQIVEENITKNKSKEKLASLFKRKTNLDLQLIKGHHSFLQKNSTESSTENDAPKLLQIVIISLSFPTISHIDQFSESNNIPYRTCSFPLKNYQKFNPLVNTLSNGNLMNSNDDQKAENYFDCENSDIKTMLLEMESHCPNVKILWKFISSISKSENPKRALKRCKSSEKKHLKQLNGKHWNVSLQIPWTEKYKPQSSKEIVGNEEAALELKTWLGDWKLLKNSQEYSSSEEFYNSDNSNLNITGNNQVAVLIGPHGCGKTASVYAVAQELGYKILEVNASTKRPGKKILKNFEEATRSHRVKKSNLIDVFTPITKIEKEENKMSQNSLILLEDVDLVFEEDEGFVSAIYQLASNTKRPIVMTLRNICSHLSRMAPQQFRIDFQPATNKKVSTLLQLIALAETGCKLPQKCADTLSQNGDIRRSILQLQYILMSGKERISLTSMAEKNTLGNDIRTYIYKPAIKTEKKRKKLAMYNPNFLDNLVDSLDRFTLISNLIEIEDPTSPMLRLNFEPSVSLQENIASYSSMNSIRLEIGNWLNDSVKKSVLSSSKKLKNYSHIYNYQLLIRERMNNSVDTALSPIPSNSLDRQALAIDYLPSIRTICRAEEARNLLNSKRGNRFFHYLQGSKFSSGAEKSGNILSAACKVLQVDSMSIQ